MAKAKVIAELLGGTYAERMARSLAGGWDTDVFHGTADDIHAFALSERGKNTQAKSAQGAFWFVDVPEVAGGYARMAAEDAPVRRLIEASLAAERRGDFDAANALTLQAEKLDLSGELVGGGGQNIMPLKIKGGNLMQIDADGATMSDLDDSQLSMWVNEAKEKGYDGLKISNFSDNADYGTYTPATHYAIFDPKNIRSVNADFNPANASSSDLLAGIQSAAPIGAGALLAGAALAPEDAEAGVITKGGKRIIESWHGSPHTFPAERLVRMPDGSQQYMVGGVDSLPDVPQGAEVIEDFPLGRFRMDKIGTGEGAQAYGHGLYSADAKETAKEYRDALANKNLFQANTENGYAAARAAGLDAGFADDVVRSIQLGVKDFDEFRRTQKKVWGKDIPESARLVFDTILKSANDGFLYRTHIDVDPDTLLDWDRPLSEQSPRFRDAILALPEVQSRIAAAEAQRVRLNELHPGRIGKIPGADIPIDASRINGDKLIAVLRQSGLSEKEVSQKLLDMGIPGIRYRDQMSRGDTAEPTFNYVMFDDKPISIVERGNASPEALAATAVATATAAALNNFQARRAAKRDYWRQMRQEITDFASAVAGGAFAALDKPLQGYMGLAGVAGTLAAGGTLPQALQHGAQIARQPSDVTAYQYGGAMTDALAPYSPQGAAIAGALTNAGIQLTSPL